MLAALRTNKGWPRAIALVLLLAFGAGVLHLHANAAFADAAVVVSDPQGHDHEGTPAPSASSHCAFCAVVAGKFYLSADTLAVSKAECSRITFLPVTSQLTSISSTDLFRPPIAPIG